MYANLSTGGAHLSAAFGSSTYARPDALWIARWDMSSSLTGWAGVPDARWAVHQRGKQYRGDHVETWGGLVEKNPVLETLEPDAEALIVNRMSASPAFAIAPIDRCYMLVGLIKASWEGISGGAGVEQAIAGYFEELREKAVPA